MSRRIAYAAIVTAVIGLAGCSASEESLSQPASAASPPAAADYANPMASSVSPQQKGRAGADANAECQSRDVKDFVRTITVGSPPRMVGGYQTDAVGFVMWGAQLRGGEALLAPGIEFPEELHALCWFSGNFSVPGIDGAAPDAASSVIVDFQQLPDKRLMVVASSPDPIGIYAPDLPGRSSSGAAQSAARVTHAQPPGVREKPAAPPNPDVRAEYERQYGQTG